MHAFMQCIWRPLIRARFAKRYQNKIVEFLEQIGRFGCFFSMFLIIPFMNSGYWFKQGKTVYLFLGVILVVLYCLGWIVFWKEDSIRKSLYLSIIPSLLFIESGIISGNILLLIFAVIFAPCHILISYMNVILIWVKYWKRATVWWRIRSSNIAFTMGAKGPLLEKAENYNGEIPLF